jgi:hypothetical protein
MPRVVRLDVPGLLQHVIVRGVERREIFVDDHDRSRFLDHFASGGINSVGEASNQRGSLAKISKIVNNVPVVLEKE